MQCHVFELDKTFYCWDTGSNRLEASHILYANDRLILAEEVQLRYLGVIQLLFEAVSGLKFNTGKSSTFPVDEVEDIQRLEANLRCQTEEFPTTYLSMTLGAKYKAKQVWHKIEDRFEKKLATWKRQYLSLGGRVTLINNMLNSLPTYLRSLFAIRSIKRIPVEWK